MGDFWSPERYCPRHLERDIVIAAIVLAVKDCLFLDSGCSEAYSAYDFLMDDGPWDIINVSLECRGIIRKMIRDPAEIPTKDGAIQQIMEIFRDL